MFNIIHLASSRGLGDAARKAHAAPQPAGASHLTLIIGGRPEVLPREPRRRRRARPRSAPRPLSG